LPRPQVRNRKVFISHGKSRCVVDQLKELLIFGDFEPVISVEQETVGVLRPRPVVLPENRNRGAYPTPGKFRGLVPLNDGSSGVDLIDLEESLRCSADRYPVRLYTRSPCESFTTSSHGDASW
jgi:hypothetical protein